MPPATLSTRPHIVVVGGGVAGLAVASGLLRALPGCRVTVLEAADRVGGKLRSEAVAGHVVDVGAESMLATRPEGVELVHGLGLGPDLVAPRTTAAQVWSRGALHPLPVATLLGVPTVPALARGVLSAAEVERAEQEQEWPAGPVIKDVAVGEYVAARLGRAVVDRLVEPLLGGVYAGHADRLSLRATMPALWQRAVAGASLLGPSGSSGPSGPSGPSVVAGRPPFAGVRGGFGRLPVRLSERLLAAGAEVRTGAVVRSLDRVPDGWRLVVGSASAPQAVTADAVVLAVPPAPAARLLRGRAPGAADLLAEVTTASTAVVTLAVRRDGLGGVPGSGLLVPPVEGRRIKAATFSAAKWQWVGDLDPDVVHLRVSIGRAGEESVLQREDAELVSLSVADLGDALGRPLPEVVDSHVQRWGGALPQYAVGHVDRVAAVRADVARLGGVEVAGATYDGVGIPAVLASAAVAVEGVRRHLGASASHDATARSTPTPSRGEPR